MTRSRYGDNLDDGRSRLSMLDRALEGASTEAKARVRGIMLRYGIEEDNEFFLIFVAIGQLLALVEDAPENWNALFDQVYGELNQWASQNRQDFDSLKLHTQTSAELVTYLQQTIAGLSTSEGRSQQAMATLDRIESKATLIEGRSSAIADEVGQVAMDLQHHSNRIRNLAELAHQQSFPLALTLGGVLILLILCIFLTVQNRSQDALIEQLLIKQQEQSEQINWLVERNIQAECRSGTLPANDPLCR